MPGGVSFLSPLTFASSGHVWERWPNVTLVDANCTNGIQWIWTLIGQCIIDARGIAAVVCGFASLLICVVNAIPQIVENFRTGIPDQAVSPIMLLFWSLGDMCNFAGCILAHQLVLQIIVSLYSIASDLILIAQFIYYKLHHQTVLAIVSHALGHGEVTLEESDPLPILESATASDRTSLLGTEDIARANPTYTRVPALYSTVGLLAISACSFASTAYHLISSSTPSVDFGNSHSPTRSSPRGFLITELPDSTISHSSLLPLLISQPPLYTPAYSAVRPIPPRMNWLATCEYHTGHPLDYRQVNKPASTACSACSRSFTSAKSLIMHFWRTHLEDYRAFMIS